MSTSRGKSHRRSERLVIPFKTKIVENISLLSKDERNEAIRSAGYNIFGLRYDQVYLDFLTDSGCGAMSSNQWSSFTGARESDVGKSSFVKFQRTVQQIFGFPFVLPVHQGRAGQHVLDSVLLKPNTVVLGNSLFPLLATGISLKDAKFVDCTTNHEENKIFNGNVDIMKLKEAIAKFRKNGISYIMITVQCQGKPMSMDNIRSVSRIAKDNEITLCIDSARFAENAYYIQKFENGFLLKSIPEIVTEMFSYFEICVMSGKKDGIVPSGGFVAVKDASLFRLLKTPMHVYEGTSGGMTAGMMEAMARGLQEVNEDSYCSHRLQQIHRFASLLRNENIPIIEPALGHCVYIDARKVYPDVPVGEFPSLLLSVDLYKEGGIRCTPFRKEASEEDIGCDWCCIPIPRRVYSIEHLEYVADVIKTVFEKSAERKNGLQIVEEVDDVLTLSATTKRVFSYIDNQTVL